MKFNIKFNLSTIGIAVNKYPATFTFSKLTTETLCAICSKLTEKTLERRQRRRLSVLIVKFEHLLHRFLVFVLLNLNR